MVSQPRTSHIRKGMDLTKLKVADHTGQISITFFNQTYLADQLKYGASYIFYGQRDPSSTYSNVLNPAFEPVDAPQTVTRRILPIYALTAGITNRLMDKLVQQALSFCAAEIPELLPQTVREQYHLCSAATAYRQIHHPDSLDAAVQRPAPADLRGVLRLFRRPFPAPGPPDPGAHSALFLHRRRAVLSIASIPAHRRAAAVISEITADLPVQPP